MVAGKVALHLLIAALTRAGLPKNPKPRESEASRVLMPADR